MEFNAKIKDLLDFYEQEYSISFDIKTPRVVCKRPLEETYDSEQQRNEETTNEVNDEDYMNYKKAVDEMYKIGRQKDFFSLLKQVADGKLNTNVGWHCALDLGRFLDLEDIRLMEYMNP